MGILLLPPLYEIVIPKKVTVIFYPDAHPEVTSVDGWVQQRYSFGSGQDWGVIRAAGGSLSDDDHILYVDCGPDDGTDKWLKLTRSILLFDTSSLPSGCVITRAVLSLYISLKEDPASNKPNINVYSSAPASNTALVAGDYNSLGSVAYSDNPLDYDDVIEDAYNDLILNAAGRGAVSKTGITKLGLRNAKHDVANVAPTWYDPYPDILYAGDTGFDLDSADQVYKPKLTITYEL